MIGSATSVLKDDFITAFENDEQFDFNFQVLVAQVEVTKSDGCSEVDPLPSR